MTCKTIKPELLDFHLAEISHEDRLRVENHLISCASCLNDFLFLKRNTETDYLSEAPSMRMRQQLRQRIEQKVSRPAAKRHWFRWEAPAVFTLAGAAVVAALFFSYTVSESPGAMPLSFSDKTVESVSK